MSETNEQAQEITQPEPASDELSQSELDSVAGGCWEDPDNPRTTGGILTIPDILKL
jgi:hypothetical protein